MYQHFKSIFLTLLIDAEKNGIDLSEEGDLDTVRLAKQFAMEAVDAFYNTGSFEYDYSVATKRVLKDNGFEAINYGTIENVVENTVPYLRRVYNLIFFRNA